MHLGSLKRKCSVRSEFHRHAIDGHSLSTKDGFRYRFVAEGGSIEGVVYLPYGVSNKGLQCTLHSPDEPGSPLYSKSNYKGASYVIKWTARPVAADVLNARLAVVRSKEDIVWNIVL